MQACQPHFTHWQLVVLTFLLKTDNLTISLKKILKIQSTLLKTDNLTIPLKKTP